MFYTLRPGILYAYDAPQMIHDLTAEAEVLGYVMTNQRPLITGRGGWQGLFLPSPRTNLTMSINAGTGLLTALASRTTSDQTGTSVTPAGRVHVREGSTSEQLSWITGKQTRIWQGLAGRYGYTDDRNGTTTDTREVGGSLGIERTFEKNSISLDASVAYLQLERIAPETAVMRSRFEQQLNPRGLLTWRHDVNKRWSVSGEGGVVFVNPVGVDKYARDEPRRSGTFPIFGGQVAYNEAWGRALLSARRGVAPNLYIAQNTVSDAANLQVAMPLPWLDETRRNPKLVALGSLGVERTQLIEANTGGTQGNFNVARFDATVGYMPRPGQTYSVRYELSYQTGDEAALMEIPEFYRNTVYFTFTLRYPERIVGGERPKRTQSTRSDKKDQMQGGADPIIPDLFNDLGE